MLESILKRLLRRKVEQKVEKVVDEALDSALNSNKAAQPTAGATQPASPVAAADYSANAGAENEWDIEYNHDINYFRQIIQANFPEYALEENVPFAQLVPGVRYQYPPYTFVMRKNGQIALVISLQSKYSYKKGLHTMCEWKAQLRHINFFIEYPDRPEYVINRIRQYLAF
ncbi:MAG: hypothetical protein J6Y67_06625 [Lachnospiraceae bacterium]|jgi:hypothetical protein|nr:hypothetical protein [Lachnospiraceae bacterium]